MTDEGSGHPETVDMSPYEAMLAIEPASDLRAEGGQGSSVEPSTGRPGVEWAIAWGDGSLTRVRHEDAARVVAAIDPAWSVVCRIVGGWDHA
jgi:hypothetical protein